MDQRVAIPTVLNGALAAVLLTFMVMLGFRDRAQMFWCPAAMIFGVFATYRVLASKVTSNLYASPWYLHFVLQPFTWAAMIFVIGALVIWGNQIAWAMMALAYLMGARFAFVVDGLGRIRA